MKKNGFTLVELLAVLIIIMLLLTITIPLVSNIINESKQKATETVVKNIEVAAKKYITDNIRDADELNKFGFMNLSLITLIENNYLESNLKNPMTNKTLFLDDNIYITLDYNSKLTAFYDINQSQKSKITLKGYLNDKVKLGTPYSDPGAIGFDGTNTNNNVTGVGTVDTSTEGIYKLEYTYNNSNTIYRYVIVTNDF